MVLRNKKKTILFVSGFVVDTYNQIEASLVELCANPGPDVQFLWLVPEISLRHNQFAKPENRQLLTEPVWVTELKKNDIPYVVGNICKYNFLANFILFSGLFRRYSIDAVYTHFGFERFWATLFAKLWRKTTIWNEHWYSLGMRYGAAKRLFYRLLVDEFIAVSGFVGRTLPPGKKVHIIPNGIRAIRPQNGAGAIRQTREGLGIKEPCKVVLMVAAFTPQKRHGTALNICREVLAKRGDVVFLFLGDGPTRLSFLQKVKQLGLDSKVLAPGHVDHVDDYYPIADVCMLTSENEGFGYCVLEAMTHSLPMIIFDTGAPAEVIRNGETGIVVREGDVSAFTAKLLELLDDSSQRSSIGEKAIQAVQSEYSRDAWISRTMSVLRDIVEEKSRQTSGVE